MAKETDLSAPLRERDLLTLKAWFKLASRWGIRKTMCFYSLFMMGVGGAIFFTLSILAFINTVWAAGLTIIVGIGSPIFPPSSRESLGERLFGALNETLKKH